jgi:hypothetical protein
VKIIQERGNNQRNRDHKGVENDWIWNTQMEGWDLLRLGNISSTEIRMKEVSVEAKGQNFIGEC